MNHNPEGGSHRAADAEAEHRGHLMRLGLLAAACTTGMTAAIALGGDSAGVWDLQRGDTQQQPSEAPTAIPITPKGAQKLPLELPPDRKVSAITDSWHMQGARYDKQTHAIRFNADGWAVRTIGEDGRETGYEPKPPQLLVGPRVKTDGQAFGITGHMSHAASSTAEFFLSAEPNVTLDESLHRMPAIGMRMADDEKSGASTLYADVYDGTKNTPAESYKLAAAPEGAADFWLQQNNTGITVGSGKKTLHVRTKLFDKQVIFGADGDFTLDNLDVYATGNEPVEIVDTSTRTLPPIAKDGFQGIAAAHGRADLAIVDAVDFTSIDDSMPLMGNIGRLKPEMLGKMQDLYKGTPDAAGNIRQEDFDFTQLKALIGLAKRSGRSFDMHTLIWGEAMPKTVENFMRHAAATGNKQAVLNFVRQYTTIVVSETKDDVDTYDVVNEPMGSTNEDNTAVELQKHLVYEAAGGFDYAYVAVEAAEAAGAKRIRINENGLETWAERRQAFIAEVVKPIAQRLKRATLVVGLQAHLDDSDIETWVNNNAGGRVDPTYVSNDVSKVANEFAAAGAKTDITELSVDAQGNDIQSAEQVQAAVYAGVADAAVRNHNITSLGFWGLYSNKRYMTTTFNADGSFEFGNDTPWDQVNGKLHEKQLVVDGIKAGLSRSIRPLS